MPVPKAPGNMNWTPYLIVGAIAIVAVGLFVVFGGGGTVGGSATSAQASQVLTPEQTAQAKTELTSVIESWRTAWQSKDMTSYMSLYATDFYSQYKQMDRTQWEQYKVGLFAKYASQTIQTGPLDIQVSPDGATVSFEQTFTAAKYTDHGTKTLKLKRSGSTWLIVGEEFAAW